MTELPTQFGIFYPTGYIVAAFPKREDAERVRQNLLTGGYDPQDCVLYTGEEFASIARSHLKDAGWLARLGKSDEMEQAQLEAAKRGSALLLIYAPSDLDTERTMNVIRRVPFELAHHYHRFAIHELK